MMNAMALRLQEDATVLNYLNTLCITSSGLTTSTLWPRKSDSFAPLWLSPFRAVLRAKDLRNEAESLQTKASRAGLQDEVKFMIKFMTYDDNISRGGNTSTAQWQQSQG